MKNYLADCHLHTNFSFDTNTDILDYCRRAREIHLDEICITDHFDLDMRKGMKKILDLDENLKAIMDAGLAFPDLKVSKGIEAGITPHTAERMQEMLASRDYDYIVCSQHLVDGMDIFFERNFFNVGRASSYARFLEVQYELLRDYDFWSAVGHMGYFTRYFPSADRKLRLSDAPDIIDAILKTTAVRGKAMEVNTAGFTETGDMLPPFQIIKRFRMLGGEIITVGSDCHGPAKLFDRIPLALALIQKAGFSYYATYSGLKPGFHKIG
jgi:histidinol-phosphatase (PHP family)